MNEEIAIVGIACRYPDANDYEEFWQNLRAGRSSIKEVSADQWPKQVFYSDEPMESGKINTKWAGTLSGSRYFDHAFFNLSPREAIAVDPQYRILMEEAWRCIEDSCLPIDLLRSSRTSVNVGVMAQDYLIRVVSTNKRVDAFDPIGNYPCMASNRISYALDLTGPSRTVDTACSASLVALSQGRSDLLHEGCDFALVGGVNVVCSPWRYLAFAQSRMLSPDGRCNTFDARANGYVPGEGAGVVLLTTLHRAHELQCHVYGVLKGIATNHNGHNRGLTAPSVAAQVDVIQRALASANVTPRRVGYVEAHGTGTSLGDPVEVEALNIAYGEGRSDPLYVGSVKTNIGHVEAGAGMAGLIKVLLMLRERTIAPTLHRSLTNPLIQGEGRTVAFAPHAVPWDADGGTRIAGVSSFGFGGVNCHAVVEEHVPPAEAQHEGRRRERAVFTLAAKSKEALAATLAAWAVGPLAMERADEWGLCRASNQRATALPYRYAYAPRAPGDLRRDIERFLEGIDSIAPVTSASLVAALVEPAAAAERSLGGPVSTLRALADAGVRFDGIAANGRTTMLAALVQSGAIALESATRVASTGASEVTLEAAPSCRLFLGTRRLDPSAPPTDALRQLVGRAARTGAEVAPYVERARILLDHQHTFARAIARWDKLLLPRGLALVEAIRAVDDAEPRPGAHMVILALAIDHALCEIGSLWGIRSGDWLHPATHELAQLGWAGEVDIERLVGAIFDESELEALARSSEWSAVMGRTVELPVEGALVAFAPFDEDACVLALGDAASCATVVGRVDVPLSDTTGEGIRDALALLWTRGQPVAWARVEPDATVRRPGLPTYRFDRHLHWHSDDGMRIDGRPPPSESSASDPGGAAVPLARREPPIAPPQAPTMEADESLQPRLEQLLRDLVADATKTSAARLQADTPFADLGIDSLIIHALTATLSRRFGETMSPTLFFECRSIRALAARIHTDHRAAVHASLGGSEGQAAPPRAAAGPAGQPGPDATHRRPRAAAPPARSDGLLEGIAIVALHARFPGADSLDEFWRNLCEGKDTVTEIPSSRWDHARYFDPRRGIPGKVYARWGGFLSDVDAFDAPAFGIGASEAQFMDPQERLFLEAAKGCLEVGGYTRRRLRETADNRVGVFAGATFNNYQLLQLEANGDRIDGGAPVNSQTYAVANRVSYVFDFSGPSLTLDTACSSSLYAIHLACDSLRRNECALAIAGGVNLSLHPSKYQMLSLYQFLSSDGRCRAFGEGGDGYVPAEAVGAFLLKRVEDAVRDGDHIYAVIRGSGVSHGGRTTGFTVPNPGAQATAITAANEQARVDPATITYLEAHGTGTRLGDPVEVAGLVAAYRKWTDRKQYCSIGSVKSNIGHAEAAAGVAQVAKVTLQMEESTLVPTLLHSDTTNRSIDFASSPVFVQRQLEDWDTGRVGLAGTPRRAGVTSIGAGGVNVHLVMEEWGRS